MICSNDLTSMSYWWRVYEKLIKRGMLIMDLWFVESYHVELERMNNGKRGSLTGLLRAMSYS